MIRDYETFAEAYQDGLGELLSQGERVEAVLDDASIASRFGTEFRPTVELRPCVFRIRQPAMCLIECEPRQPYLGYAVGQWMWVMSGAEDLAQVVYYNPIGKIFSEDGSRLAGAFGARIRRNAGDQLTRAIDLLRRDPGSRRAVVTIAEAADNRSTMRDFPCATGLHFMLREGKLEVITTMRSQSALMVFPYDAALFMMLHVWAAAKLGVECGPHTWIANSFHVYEDELALARKVLTRGVSGVGVPTVVAQPMEARFERLQEFERQLRAMPLEQSPLPIPDELSDPDELHGAVAAALLAHAASRSSDQAVWADAHERLPAHWQPIWRSRTRARA